MKNIALSFLLAIFCMTAFAQSGNNGNSQLPMGTMQPKVHWQPQGHQFSSNEKITLMIVSPNNERFWLYINDQLCCSRQSASIAKVGLSPNHIYNIKILMDNRSRNTVSESICIGGNSDDIILTIEKSQGYGFFSGQYYQMLWNGQRINPGNGNYAYIWTYRNDPRGMRFASGMDFYPITVVATQTQPIVPPTPPAMMPCSSHDFQNIKNIVRSQTFESDRMNVALQAVRGKRLTAEQIADLAELFKFENDRVKFLKSAYNDCFDKPNYYVVYRVLTFSSSKDELTRFIQNH